MQVIYKEPVPVSATVTIILSAEEAAKLCSLLGNTNGSDLYSIFSELNNLPLPHGNYQNLATINLRDHPFITY